MRPTYLAKKLTFARAGPTRQIVVVLSGVLEVGTSDGHTQQWGAGEAFMPDDLRGKGHTTRTIGGPVRALYIPLPQDFDL
jgi:hypothetical protein